LQNGRADAPRAALPSRGKAAREGVEVVRGQAATFVTSCRRPRRCLSVCLTSTWSRPHINVITSRHQRDRVLLIGL